MSTQTKAVRSQRRARRGERGQAMLEYSLLNWVLIAGLVLGMSSKLIPTPEGQRNVIELFLESYQIYYDSFYFVLNLPFP